MLEAQKRVKPVTAPKKQAKAPPKKKGAAEEEPAKPKEKTRDDFRLLSELYKPFKAQNFEYRLN